MNTLQERIAELFNGEMPSDDEIISHIDFSVRYKKAEKVESRLKSIITYLFDSKHKARYMIPKSWDEWGTTICGFDKYDYAKDEWWVELIYSFEGMEATKTIHVPNSWVVEDDWKPLIDVVTDSLRQEEDKEKSAAAKEKFKNRLANKPPVIIHLLMVIVIGMVRH